ncbi:MAG: 16S rRNA (guanine(527)-N(7))-methyltransferase RsmG [Desulfovibrionaceae bacterium]
MTGTFALAQRLSEEGAHLDPGARERISGYLDLLTQWNRKTNLVGPRDPETIFETLIVDSLQLGPFLDSLGLPDQPLCLDLGAGAGLPGIPLRCFWQRGEYHLVEVREKRCVFMRLAVGRLKLPCTHVLQGRAEDALASLAGSGGSERLEVEKRRVGQDAGAEQRALRADLILSRAFMPWQELLPFVRPMLAAGGRVVVLANEAAPDNPPASWKMVACTSYGVRHGEDAAERWFWALRREDGLG